MRRRPLLCPDLHELAIFLLRLNQHLALSRIVAAWLLHINVFARLQSGDCHRCVPVFGRGNRDGVYILLLEYSAEVLFCDRGLTHFLLRAISELFENVAVHVADM